VDFEALIQQNR
jgi:hypothetical protein